MTQSSQFQRYVSFGALSALVFWFALALQLMVSLQLSYARGSTTLQGLWVFFAYFTILTNLLAAFALSCPVFAPRSALGLLFARPGAITAVATYMILVGITYNLLLRNVWQPQGWQLVADLLLHSVNPILFAIYWWLNGRSRELRYSTIFAWAVYPLAYFVYAIARGMTGDFYAYPFIDVDALGIGRVLINAVAIAIGFAALASILVALGRRVSRPRI